MTPTSPADTRFDAPLPPGIRSRHVDDVNGLSMHVLEAGRASADRPMVLLLHGFPELAYSWRAIMPALADAGYHVVAPDQRGYGLTTGWDRRFDGDLRSFRLLNLAKDALALAFALGRRTVHAVVGHDFGSPVAACCALARPDVFGAVAMMSAPFGGPPALSSGGDAAAAAHARGTPGRADRGAVQRAIEELAKLDRPRKHYQWYYSTRRADHEMRDCAQGLHAFLRAYYHVKSADWAPNVPHPLAAWSAEELAKLPTYYVMDLAQDMAQTVAQHMPSADAIAACRWLPDEALAVYTEAFARTGFQGGLQWYRCGTTGLSADDLALFAGRTIDVPSCFVAGASDWGVHQKPGEFEAMQSVACTDMRACELVPGAGHWVQQEQPEATARLLLDFLNRSGR